MCSSEDCEKLWFLYKLEGEPKGVSIEQFCIKQGVPYQVFNKWFRDRYSVCGYLWIVVMLLFLRFRTNSFVDWISNLSFEMYLVHHMLCTGPVSIISFDASPALNYIILIGITLGLAVFLHFLSQRIQQCFVY